MKLIAGKWTRSLSHPIWSALGATHANEGARGFLWTQFTGAVSRMMPDQVSFVFSASGNANNRLTALPAAERRDTCDPIKLYRGEPWWRGYAWSCRRASIRSGLGLQIESNLIHSTFSCRCRDAVPHFNEVILAPTLPLKSAGGIISFKQLTRPTWRCLVVSSSRIRSHGLRGTPSQLCTTMIPFMLFVAFSLIAGGQGSPQYQFVEAGGWWDST
jgi:hypothetical protein